MTREKFQTLFPNEESVIQYFIRIRYNGAIYCNHCLSDNVKRRSDKPKVFRCNNCRKDFSIFKDTMFEDTYTDLVKWMDAIRMFLNAKKGISSLQLKRELGVTTKTAWRMLHRIRTAMGNKGDVTGDFRGIIEQDETYVGGRPRKGNKHQYKGEIIKRGRGTKKTPVIGVLCRKTKQVHARVALPDAEGKKLKGTQLMKVANEVINRKVIMITDEFTGYNILKRTHHVHFKVDHTKEYARGFVHTNHIEGFWSLMKRGIVGSYHHISVKYMQNYVNEFCYRYNNRDEMEAFDKLVGQSVNC